MLCAYRSVAADQFFDELRKFEDVDMGELFWILNFKNST